MKYELLFASILLMTTSAKKLSGEDYKSPTDQELMNELLGNTVFSGDHNHVKDNQFLTEEFAKYSELGTDSTGAVNGKRVFTPWTAKYLAKDILREWKGLKGEELEDYVEGETFKKIFKEFDYQNAGVLDQRDAYVWARKLVGEDYEGIPSSEYLMLKNKY